MIREKKGGYKMLKMVNQVKQAQDYLKNTYGEEGYKKLVNAFRNKVENIIKKAPDISELDVINYVVKSEELPADIKLVALSYLGEGGIEQ